MPFASIPKKLQTDSVEDLFEIWTPSEIEAYLNTVNASFNEFAVKHPDIINTKWTNLKANFDKFIKELSWYSNYTVSTVRAAELFAKQLNSLKAELGEKSDTIVPAEDNQEYLDILKVLAYTTMIIVVIGGIVYLVKRFSK